MDDRQKLTRARNDPFGPRKRKAFLDVFSQTANISFACKKAGISRQTYYDTIARDPEFALLVADAEEEATDSLEGVAWHKAKVERDNTSLWNLLKARRPQKYRDTTDHNFKGEVVYKVTRMPTDEL